MKKSIFTLLLLFFTATLFAQDKIYFKNGEIVDGDVKDITSKFITYRKKNNPDGPTYEISRRNVYMVEFENGVQEVFGTESGKLFNQKKNIVSINYGDLALLRASVSYERLFFDGNFGLKVPFSVSLEGDSYGFNGTPLYQSGLDINYYPMGQSKLSYYTGIGGRIGELRRNTYALFYGNDGIGLFNSSEHTAFFLGTYVNNGLILNFTERFSINGMLGLGFRYEETDHDIETHVIGEMSASFRF